MDTPWNIKLLELRDLDAFYSLFEKSLLNQFPEYSPSTRKYFATDEYSKEKMETILKKGERDIFIALNNDKIIGYLTTNKVYGGIGFCEWLGVDTEYQHKGVGTALLKAYEKVAIKDGAHKLHLWTADKNIAFYEKNGYVLVGKIPANYFGADDFLMYKILQEPKEENYV